MAVTVGGHDPIEASLEATSTSISSLECTGRFTEREDKASASISRPARKRVLDLRAPCTGADLTVVYRC